jgi:hypothetical protein
VLGDFSENVLDGEGRAGGVVEEWEVVLRGWLGSRGVGSGSIGESSSMGVCVRSCDEAERVGRGLFDDEDASGVLLKWEMGGYGVYDFGMFWLWLW